MILDPSLWGTYAGTFADWEEEGVREPYYKTPDGKVTLLHGHVLDVLREIPAESVNCVVTSPPYWSLRKYDCEPVIWGGESDCEHDWTEKPIAGEGYTGTARWQHSENGRGEEQPTERRLRDPVSRETRPEAWSTALGATATCSLCGAWRGQYGLEPTPELYVEHTMMWLREVRRVLRKDGALWLNIGDGYASGSSGHAGESQLDGGEPSGSRSLGRIKPPGNGLKAKDAVLMPFRVALAAQAEGFWVRSVIIWHKNNPMPESVKDRPTDAHEYIFLLTKSKTYWYDAEAVREPHADSTLERYAKNAKATNFQDGTKNADRDSYKGWGDYAPSGLNPDGRRNCRSVWTFPTEPFPDAHFAVFPRELPERCIKAGAPVDGVVLDPFAGSGTTCEVAYHLGCRAIGIDASAKYLDMAVKRLSQEVLAL